MQFINNRQTTAHKEKRDNNSPTMDADDDQNNNNNNDKLTELKKAYAEVILNTAKEAAARIMLSERKVIRLEIELKQSKEKALQMLTTLKHMMDAKKNEAEMTSQAQQKRIEELEAQLHEAEDIVTVLREELSAVHGEKERASQKGSNFDKDEGNKGRNYIFPSLKSRVNEKYIPAIILRGKGRKRNRSECTHAGEKIQTRPSFVNEEEKDRKRGSPNKKERSPGQVNKMNCVATGSYLTTSQSIRPREKGLVSISNVFSRLREELERRRPPTPIREELERPSTPIREELVPTGREMPLSSETHVGALVTGELLTRLTSSRVIKYTFQRKRKRGTNGSDLSNKLKRNEEVTSMEKSDQDETEKIDKSTTEKVISTEEETEKVISTEESTEEDVA